MPTKKTLSKTTPNARKHCGKTDGDVAMFPAAPSAIELPADYADWLSDLKTHPF